MIKLLDIITSIITKLENRRLFATFYRSSILGKSSEPNQYILKEISPGISLEGMMLKLKLDREAWRAAIHGVVKRWTRLSD